MLFGTGDRHIASHFCRGWSSDPNLGIGQILLLLMLDFFLVGPAVLTALRVVAAPLRRAHPWTSDGLGGMQMN